MKPQAYLIEVKLPDTYENYKLGNGETCFVVVDSGTKDAQDNGVTGGIWFGLLDNDSYSYPGINAGEEIAFEMRGEKQPVAMWQWIESLQTELLCPTCSSTVKEEWDKQYEHPFYCPRCDTFYAEKEVLTVYHA